jgi:aldehyde:ferredoxin oxidoreductase
MSKYKGYMGKILRVDMTNKTTEDWDVGDDFRRKYYGGLVMGSRIMYDLVDPTIDELGPDNKVILMTSPVTGTPTFAASLVNVTVKSPLINNMTNAQLNGSLGRVIKTAGYDGIIIEGASDTWQYVTLIDGKVEFHDADELMGKTTFETEDAIREITEQPKASVFCIGPAGENLVKFAAVESDRGHFASSSGPGAVLGSKKLKAFLVAPGKHKIEVANSAELKAAVKEFGEQINAFPATKARSLAGTNSTTPGLLPMGMLPFKNLQQNDWEGFPNYDAFKMHANPDVTFKKDTCYACPIGHCYEFEITGGKHKGIKGDEAEYEGWAFFGFNLLIEDPLEALYGNYLNDCMGMDLKECGFTLSWAVEAFDKGFITKEDTDGLELAWGDAESIATLIDRIGHREGKFASLLADGIWRASQQFGEEAAKIAVWGKRHAPHAHDPRSGFSLATSQALSDHGSMAGGNPGVADANSGYPEVFDLRDPFKSHEAAGIISKRMVWRDTMLICMFAESAAPTSDILVKISNLVTGMDLNPFEAMEIAERGNHIARTFSLLAGLTADDDDLSYRLKVDSPEAGPTAGIPIVALWDKMKPGWYTGMGWDTETSKPLPENLTRVGLEDLIPVLWP